MDKTSFCFAHQSID